MILIWPITGGINWDYLIKVMSVRFSTLKLHIFPLWLTSILWGDTLRLCKYPSSNILPLVLVSIDVSRLSEVLWLPNGIFSFHHSFHNHQLAFHPTHVFIHISIKCMDTYFIQWIIISCYNYLSIYLFTALLRVIAIQ